MATKKESLEHLRRVPLFSTCSAKDLEKVLYFAAHICTYVDEEARAADLSELERKVVGEREELEAEREQEAGRVGERLLRRRKYIATGSEDGFDDDGDVPIAHVRIPNAR